MFALARVYLKIYSILQSKIQISKYSWGFFQKKTRKPEKRDGNGNGHGGCYCRCNRWTRIIPRVHKISQFKSISEVSSRQQIVKCKNIFQNRTSFHVVNFSRKFYIVHSGPFARMCENWYFWKFVPLDKTLLVLWDFLRFVKICFNFPDKNLTCAYNWNSKLHQRIHVYLYRFVKMLRKSSGYPKNVYRFGETNSELRKGNSDIKVKICECQHTNWWQNSCRLPWCGYFDGKHVSGMSGMFHMFHMFPECPQCFLTVTQISLMTHFYLPRLMILLMNHSK